VNLYPLSPLRLWGTGRQLGSVSRPRKTALGNESVDPAAHLRLVWDPCLRGRHHAEIFVTV
jgi:hypothetical protein